MVGKRISEYYKVTKDTKRVLTVQIYGGKENEFYGERINFSGILDTGKIKEKIDKPLIEKVNITKSIKDFIVNLINRFK